MLALGLGVAGFVLPMLMRSPTFEAAVYLLATTVLTFELADIAVRLWIGRMAAGAHAAGARYPSSIMTSPLGPYAIVLSVHNFKAGAAKTLEPLLPFKSRVWIIDDCSSDETVLYLRSKGWRCLDSPMNRKKPGAIRSLLERLPKDIATVIVLDPDSAPLNSGRYELPDLEHAVRRFQYSGAAACCPRIRIREDGPLVSFQLLECELVFALGRKGMSPYCITTGVSIYDRAALQATLDEHSLSVYAEDLENSLILLDRGFDVHFDEGLVVETEGKHHLPAWFSQRVGWSFGLLRVCVTRWREILKIARRSPWAFYNLAIYMGLMTVVLFPVKMAGIVVLAASLANTLDALLGTGLVPDNAWTDPAYFSATYATYTLLAACMAAYMRPPARPMTLVLAVSFYLFYAAANVLAMCLGYLNWLSLHTIGRRVYKDHYTDADASILGSPLQAGGEP